jgi:hypothetical protein
VKDEPLKEEELLKERIKSRKFIITGLLFMLIPLIPIAYHGLGIGENVVMMVVGAISTLGTGYIGFNVLEKRGGK